MNQNQTDVSVWDSALMHLVRWVIFLPIAFVLLAIVEWIALSAIQFSLDVELKFTLFTLLLGIFIFSVGSLIVVPFFAALYSVPRIACTIVAPRPRGALIVFGTLFVLFSIANLIGLLGLAPWWVIVFKIIVFCSVMAGVIGAYSDE